MNFVNHLKKITHSKKATIGVIGMGYVGLPLALLAAKKKFRVNCYERDNYRLNMLRKKILFF